MSTRSDEQHETNAPQREGSGTAKRKRSRPWGLLALAFALGLLMWSCIPKGYLISSSVDELSTGEAVIAIRMGEARSQSGLSAPIHDNWIMLLDAQGKHTAALLEEENVGELLWTERGISYGSEQWDYLTTEHGTRRDKRSGWNSSEVQRYELSDGRIIVVSYEMDLAYQVDTIELDGSVTSVSTPGTRGDVGQCGDRILSIVDTKQLWRMKSEAFEAYSAQSGGDGEQPEELSVVIQLNDRDGDTPRLLGVAPMIDGLVSGQREFACEGDVITVPSKQLDDPEADTSGGSDAGDGALVIERWDLSTGQRAIIPVHDEAGNAIKLEGDRSVVGARGVQVGNDYRFISRTGDAYTVDLVSGQGRRLFSIPSTKTDNEVLFQVTESGVYALEDREEDRLVALSYQSWDGGDKRDVFTTGKLEKYLRTNSGILSSGYRRGFESFALRPGWDGGAQ